MKQDGDEVLKAQDAAVEKAVVMQSGRWERFKNGWAEWWGNPRKRYGTIAAVVIIVGGLMGVPLTRYDILGVVIKSQMTVKAVDSKSGAPVSGASVQVGNQAVETDASGEAVLRVHAGSRVMTVSKKYYAGYTHKELVTLSTGHNKFTVPLIAEGRQVPVKVVDAITGKPLANAVIVVQEAKTKTDKNGMVNVVIPSSATSQKVTVSLAGYNTLPTTITADASLDKNTFDLVPAGKLYFLSNLSGKIDVVKTNLDGSDRQTVLAGTGSEDRNTTSLLASRDWKYLALLSNRSGNGASVYIIDTTNGDKLSTIDQGAASFSLLGWSGDTLVYQTARTAVSDWQANQQALKSYDAATGQSLLLDQTQASGTSENDYVKQFFNTPYIIGSQLVYVKGWVGSFSDAAQVSSKQAELDSIGVNGTGHKTLKTFAPASGANINYLAPTAVLYKPGNLHISFSDGNADTFYSYDGSQVSPDPNMTDTTFYQTTYTTYLLSPSGNQTFWAEQRDGKNTLFVGNADGSSPKQIASLSDYNAYGWYTDNYLLVSKSGSELYIMPAAGGNALKITDYYKPAVNYNGYGGGYGGL